MRRTRLSPLLQNLLRKVPYATIATTCANGAPWNTPVRAFLAADLTLYWVSARTAQHSINIGREPRVFVVIYNSRLRWPRAHRRGLYMQMHAKALEDKDVVQRIRQQWQHAFGEVDDPDAFTGDNPRRIYQAVVRRAWTNTKVTVQGHQVDSRIELAL